MAFIASFWDYILEEPYFRIILGIFPLYWLYYELIVVRPITLHIKSGTKFDGFLQSTLKEILNKDYRPSFWFFESRIQTAFAAIVRSTIPHISYRREILKLTDGGEVVLDWNDDGILDSTRPIVLLLPGLTGNSNSEYVRNMSIIAKKLDYRGVVFNYRGLGGHKLKTPRTYCAANTEDLSSVIDHINQIYPDAPIMAVGISLGGMKLGNYLSSQGAKCVSKLVAAMMISVCWDPFHGCESLEKTGLNFLLNRHLTNCLVNSIKEVQHKFDKEALDLKRVFSSRTIKEFDSSFTIHQFGYKNVQEYYQDARLVGKLKNIQIPVLAINSKDDPCQPGESIPCNEAIETDNVAILTTEYGGHIGFLEGSLPNRISFTDRVFERVASSIFDN